MDCKLGKDEHWQRDQESNVRFDIVQEWDLDSPANGVPLDHRQEQEWQPR
jgi:hypothetical protein